MTDSMPLTKKARKSDNELMRKENKNFNFFVKKSLKILDNMRERAIVIKITAGNVEAVLPFNYSLSL